MSTKINHLAVWILIVVYFLIGWGWYAIFGEKWLNLHARTMTDIEHTHNVSAYVLAFLASIAVNYTLAVLIARINPTSVWCGLKVALACWFAFVLWNTRPFLCSPRSKPIRGRLSVSTRAGPCSAWHSAVSFSAPGGSLNRTAVADRVLT